MILKCCGLYTSHLPSCNFQKGPLSSYSCLFIGASGMLGLSHFVANKHSQIRGENIGEEQYAEFCLNMPEQC